MKMKKQIIIRLEAEHAKQLKVTAAEKVTSIQKLIESALKNYELTRFKK